MKLLSKTWSQTLYEIWMLNKSINFFSMAHNFVKNSAVPKFFISEFLFLRTLHDENHEKLLFFYFILKVFTEKKIFFFSRNFDRRPLFETACIFWFFQNFFDRKYTLFHKFTAQDGCGEKILSNLLENFHLHKNFFFPEISIKNLFLKLHITSIFMKFFSSELLFIPLILSLRWSWDKNTLYIIREVCFA